LTPRHELEQNKNIMEQSILQREPVRLADNVVLPRARVHEVLGRASDSFAVLTAAQTRGAIFWIGERAAVGTLTPFALSDFIDPTRIVLIETSDRKETLWATEQSLRCPGAAVVITQLHLGPDLRESRRLQLAAETGGGLGLVLIERRAQASAAQTRWECEPDSRADMLGAPRLNAAGWSWALTKNKAGPVGRWRVDWSRAQNGDKNGQKGYVHLAAATAA
jgi:protein ImuA